jgi:hypothetical protein
VAPDRDGAAQHGDLAARLQLAGYPVHHADELGHECGGRVGVQLVRRGDLLEPALVHDAHPVRHGQGFLLVVGDEQGGGAQPLLQRADPLAQLQPHLGVQRGQRLVEQQHPGLDGQRPGQRDALLLAAGQLVRVLPGLGSQPDHIQQVAGPLAPAGPADLAHPEPEGHVVQRGHVREQAVALEHHAHVPLGGRHRGDVLAVDQDRPGIGGLEAGHDAQGGGLAAAGRSEQRDELARRHLDGQPVQGPGGAERAGQVLQQHARPAAGPGLSDGTGRRGGVAGGVSGHQSPRVS